MVDFAAKKEGHGEVEVSFGKEKLRVALPPPNSPLSALKATLFNMTGIQPDHQTLISSGAILKDDLAPLSSFGLVDDEPSTTTSSSTTTTPSFWQTWFSNKDSGRKLKKLILIGSKETLSRVDDRLGSRKIPVQEEVVEKLIDDEPTVINKIIEISGKGLETLEPEIVKLEAWIAQQNGGTSTGGEEKKKKKKKKAKKALTGPEMTETVDEAAALAGSEEETTSVSLEAPNPRTPIMLSEALLQKLLKLDGFEIPSSYLEARKERKEAVRKLQGALDRVDAAKEALKSKL